MSEAPNQSPEAPSQPIETSSQPADSIIIKRSWLVVFIGILFCCSFGFFAAALLFLAIHTVAPTPVVFALPTATLDTTSYLNDTTTVTPTLVDSNANPQPPTVHPAGSTTHSRGRGHSTTMNAPTPIPVKHHKATPTPLPSGHYSTAPRPTRPVYRATTTPIVVYVMPTTGAIATSIPATPTSIPTPSPLPSPTPTTVPTPIPPITDGSQPPPNLPIPTATPIPPAPTSSPTPGLGTPAATPSPR